MLVSLLALVVAAVFSGAAIYVNFAEHPARLRLDDRSLLTEWKPAYKRGFMMQAPLACAGMSSRFGRMVADGRVAFAIGGLLMIANVACTVFGIMPTNNILVRMDLAAADPHVRALIVKWNALHAVRSGPGVLATFAFLIALLD